MDIFKRLGFWCAAAVAVIGSVLACGAVPPGRWTVGLTVALAAFGALGSVFAKQLAGKSDTERLSENLPDGPKERASDKPPAPPSVLPLIFFVLIPLVSGCACWSTNANTKECVITRGVLNCAQGAGESVAPATIANIWQAISGGSPDWGALLGQLEAQGIKSAACVLAVIENAFVSAPGASPDDTAKKQHVHDSWMQFFHGKYAPGTVLKVGGTTVR